MLGIDFDMDKADEARSYYETPYIIYANDSAKKVIGKNFERGATQYHRWF